MSITRKATIEDLLAMQACNQSENRQINYYFCHHILSWLQFPYVAEDYGGKIAGYVPIEEETTECHGHITSISDLQKLGLAIKFMAAAQNATEQAKKRHRVYFMACDNCQEAKIRPKVDYMDKVHEYANPRMRAVVRDWPVELLQMELAVPNILKLELMAPTVGCFLNRFVRGVEGVNEGPLEYLASYICELSYMEYGMLCYAPSVVAASAIFIARYLLFPSQKPWDSTLRRYTQYQPSDLCECVKALLTLVTQCANSTLPAIREKLYLVTESGEKNLNLDYDSMDPHLCQISPFDDYLSLRAIEVKKRIRVDYMDKVQDYAKPYMRESIVDWLVLVAAFFELSNDTLYLAIYYMDLYLSGTVLGRKKFQLLGATCMMIASKYEEICPVDVEDLCHETKGRYSVDELMQMEESVLNILEFELWAPTVGCFLERLVIVAQHVNEEAPFECLASYISELSLMDYGMLCYAPSVVAASAVFLARYMLSPSQKPWNSTFTRFTQYQPSDLKECVKALHTLVTQPPNPTLSAIRKIYSKKQHFRVAKKYRCPPSIPMEHFENSSSSAS